MSLNTLTLIIQSGGSIEEIIKNKLEKELINATNIKSREKRISAMTLLSTTINKLKDFNDIPKNGLIVKCDVDKIEVTIPDKPIRSGVYIIDNMFHECE